MQAQRLYVRPVGGLAVLMLALAAARAQEADEVVPLKTPEEFWEQVLWETRMGKFERARYWLKRLIDSQPSDDVLLGIQEKYGDGCFVRFVNIEATRPLGQQLVERVSAIVERQASDPKRINRWLDQLSDPKANRAEVLGRLRTSSLHAVGLILQRLHSRNYTAQHATLAAVLGQLLPTVAPALVAVAESTRNVSLQVYALRALGALRDPQAIGPLLALIRDKATNDAARAEARQALWLIARQEAERMPATMPVLLEEAARHYRRQYDPLSAPRTVQLWRWSDEQGLSFTSVPLEAAADLLAWQACRRALRVDPYHVPAQAMFLSVAFQREAAGRTAGRPEALGPHSPAVLARAAGPAVCNAGLRQALADRQWAVAFGFCRALADVGQPDLLIGEAGRPSPLGAALRAPDRYVRTAAALAVLRVRPQRDFPNSPHVVPALAAGTRAAQDAKRVLIADPDKDRLAALRAKLVGSRLDVTAVSSGLEARLAAAEETGFHIALLHADLKDPAVPDLIPILRKDPRWGDVPLVIVADQAVRHRWQALTEADPLVFFMVPNLTPEQLLAQLSEHLVLTSAVTLSAAEQAALAAEALEGLRVIARNELPIFGTARAFTLLTDTLNDPKMGATAAEALGTVPSAKAQQVLADQIIRLATEPAVRLAAVKALCTNIRAFRCQVTADRLAKLLALAAAPDAKLPADVAAMLEGCLGLEAREIGRRFLDSAQAEPLPGAPAGASTPAAAKSPAPEAPATAPSAPAKAKEAEAEEEQ